MLKKLMKSQLQNHIYGGVAVSNSDGVICIGGFKDGELSKEVVRYSIEEGKLQTEQMPDLPVAISGIKAALEILNLCSRDVRLPLVPIQERNFLSLKKELEKIVSKNKSRVN